MDRIRKNILRLPDKERKKLIAAFDMVMAGRTEGLNIKRLKGHQDMYRLRVGNNRLVFRQTDGQSPEIVFVGKRDDQTYRNF